MRSVTILMLCFTLSAAEGVWAPMPIYEYTVTERQGDAPPRIGVQTAWGLPPGMGTPFQLEMPPQGFSETKTVEDLVVKGTSTSCEKRSWKRGPESEFPNHRCATITAWTSSALKSPSFILPVPGGMDFPIPAGCIRYQVDPLTRSDREVDEFSIAKTVSAQVTWAESAIRTVGVRSLAIERYKVVIAIGDRGEMTGTIDVSEGIPGGLVGLDFKWGGPQAGSVKRELTAWKDAPLPEGLQSYDGGRFGFIAPKPFISVPARAGEICRFENGPAFLAISSFNPEGKMLDDWFTGMSKPLRKIPGFSLEGSGYRYPSLQCLSATYGDRKNDLEHCFVIREGRGYQITYNGFSSMVPDQKMEMLAHWRWPASK